MASGQGMDSTLLYDLVLAGGRVIDPESGLDAPRFVGISGDRVARISSDRLPGKRELDVSGLVVAPGFINVNSHSWTPLGQDFEVSDGVTTALELEAGACPAASFGTYEPIRIAGNSRLNFGCSVSHAFARAALLEGAGAATGFDQLSAQQIAGTGSMAMNTAAFEAVLDAAQVQGLEQLLREELAKGVGLGIGMLLDYLSEVVSDAEMRAIFSVAGDTGAPIIVHVRRGNAGDSAGLREIISYARDSGARVHICHVHASAMGGIEEFLDLIRTARKAGVSITTESYPYNAGSTLITAAVFNRNWQEVFGISYEDIELASTGERLTRESWDYYREHAPESTIIHHYNREEWSSIATTAPDVMVAADGVPIFSLDAKVTPFGIGSNARTLGRYVREQRSLSLVDALRKMTLLPADMLSAYNPAFRRKGRLQEGMDADITVFDPATVIDRATFREPYQRSAGIEHVLVNGEFVVRDGELVQDAYPGRRIQRFPS